MGWNPAGRKSGGTLELLSISWWVQWQSTKKKGLSRKTFLSRTAPAAALALVPNKKCVLMSTGASAAADDDDNDFVTSKLSNYDDNVLLQVRPAPTRRDVN